MKIAFIATKDYAYDRIVESICKLGHEVIEIKPNEMSVQIDTFRPLLLVNGKKLVTDIIVHKMSTDFRDGLACLESVKDQYIIINSAESVLRSADKFLSSAVFIRDGVPVPKSTFTQNDKDIQDAADKYGYPLVIKQSDGCEGEQVGLAKSSENLIETLKTIRERGYSVIAQEFIEESFGEDIRIIVVGNNVIAAMKRAQKDPNEFRANIHKGAIGYEVVITREEEAVAIKAVKAIGLDFAGVDILRSKEGPLVLETNSFPGLEGIEKATGQNVAEAIVESIVELAERKLPKVQSLTLNH